MKESNRLKYLELPKVFRDRASAIDIHCKTSQRVCEQLAKRLAKEKPKTAQEMDRLEYMKDFVMKTSMCNESTLELLDYMKNWIQAMSEDVLELSNIEAMRDRLKFNEETIKIITQQRNDLMNDLGRRYKENTQQPIGARV